MKAVYQEKLVSYFEENILLEITINKLAKLLKFDYGALNRIMNKLIDDNVFTTRIIGHSKICKINLNSDNAILLLSKASSEKKTKFYNKNKEISEIIKELINNITNSNNTNSNLIKTIVLFGSYTKGLQTKKSDIDFLFIAENKEKARNLIESECNTMYLRHDLKFNPIIMESKEFLDTLKDKRHNLIKDIINDKIILYGFESFWYLLRKNE